MKSQFVRLVGSPLLLRWGAPLRTLRQLFGWRPRRVPVGEARRILVIRPDELGDLVLTGPFLRELRRAAPQAKITLLVKPGCYDLVRHCPHVDAVHLLKFAPHWDKPGYLLRLCAQVLKLRWTKMRGNAFDLILLPRRDTDWYASILAGHLLAGHGAIVIHCEQVVKNDVPAPPLPPVHVFPLSNPKVEHEVLHQLYFLSACGGEVSGKSHLEIWLTEADRAFARDWLAEAFRQRSPLVVLHPSGGRSVLKQWPKPNFRALLNRLVAETTCNVLVIGGAEENWIAREIIDAPSERVVEAAGKFGLRQLAAVLEQSALFVGGDSGPMHVAAAAGAPVRAIFGPTCETRFRPWGDNCRVISLRYECSPDRLGTYHDRCGTCRFSEVRCLTELPVETVFNEIRITLGQRVAARVGGHSK